MFRVDIEPNSLSMQKVSFAEKEFENTKNASQLVKATKSYVSLIPSMFTGEKIVL